MTAPKRRWFRFSLRTMLVVVTASSLLLWCYRPWVPILLRAYGVSQSDYSTFSGLVANDPRVRIKHLVSIEIPVPGEVKLVTGNPLDQSSTDGEEIELRKRDGEWVITAIRPRSEAPESHP